MECGNGYEENNVSVSPDFNPPRTHRLGAFGSFLARLAFSAFTGFSLVAALGMVAARWSGVDFDEIESGKREEEGADADTGCEVYERARVAGKEYAHERDSTQG